MKLKDYLHYYLYGNIYEVGVSTCQLMGIGDSYYTIKTKQGTLLTLSDRANIKLVLRRLEDMTEGEAMDLAKLQHDPKRHKTIDVLYIQANHLHYIDGTTWSGDGVSEYNEYFVYFNQLRQDQTHYLLRQHLDLFGLIDAGLAIDAKAITP